MYNIDNTVSAAGNYGFPLEMGLASICVPNLTSLILYLGHCAVTKINILLLLSLPLSPATAAHLPHTSSACWVRLLAAALCCPSGWFPTSFYSSHSPPTTVPRLHLLQGLSHDCFRLDQTLLDAVFTPRSTAIISLPQYITDTHFHGCLPNIP